MRYTVTLLAVVATACGGDGTTGVGGSPAALSIVAGANQSDTVLATLATPITVEVRDGDSNPVSGVVVNFVVTTEDCGAPFAGSASTDAQGRAADIWTLGTKAGSCTMEVRAVTSAGVPQILGSTEATILPGAITDVETKSGSAWIGEKIAIGDVAMFSDAHGNAIGPVTLTGEGANIDRVGDSLSWAAERGFEVVYEVRGRGSAEKLAWLQDLRLHDWTLTFSCSGGTPTPHPNGPPNPGPPPDSIAVTLTINSVVYDQLGLAGPGRHSTVGDIHYSGVATRFFPDDTVEVVTDDDNQFTHRSGSIDFANRGDDAVSVDPVPSTYTGGNWCAHDVVIWAGWDNESTAIFSRIP